MIYSEFSEFVGSELFVGILSFLGVVIASVASIVAILVTNQKQKELDEYHRRISPIVGIYLNRTYKFPVDLVKNNGGSIILRKINVNDLLQQSAVAIYVYNYNEYKMIDPHFTINYFPNVERGEAASSENFAITTINKETIIVPVTFKSGVCSFSFEIVYKTEGGETLKYVMEFDHNTENKTGKLYLKRTKKYILIDELSASETLIRNSDFISRLERRTSETSVTTGDTGVAGKSDTTRTINMLTKKGK